MSKLKKTALVIMLIMSFSFTGCGEEEEELTPE